MPVGVSLVLQRWSHAHAVARRHGGGHPCALSARFARTSCKLLRGSPQKTFRALIYPEALSSRVCFDGNGRWLDRPPRRPGRAGWSHHFSIVGMKRRSLAPSFI